MTFSVISKRDRFWTHYYIPLDEFYFKIFAQILPEPKTTFQVAEY